MQHVDATPLHQGLHQGGAPTSADALIYAGFRRLVLCAREIQPLGHALRGVQYIRVPMNDDPTVPLSDEDWQRALGAGCSVASQVAEGHKVLVTCAQGRNRSGLVSTIALHVLTGRSGSECIAFIQRRRKNACQNPQFNRAVIARLR